MKTSHAGLGITEAGWQASLPHVSAALERCGVAFREKAFWAILQEYQDDIVEKSATSQSTVKPFPVKVRG